MFMPVAEDRVREPEEVVNTSFQVEQVFHPNKPWDRWWPNEREYLYRPNPVVIDDYALIKACNMIGLIHKPEIFHDVQEIGCTHRPQGLPAFVCLDHFVTPQAASTALWHELAHCLQHERNGFYQDGTGSYDLLSQSIDAYWDDPHEIEARKYERKGSQYPLAAEFDGTWPTPFNPPWMYLTGQPLVIVFD